VKSAPADGAQCGVASSVAGAGQHRHKLVATQPGHGVLAPHTGFQALGHLALAAIGVRVVSMRRASGKPIAPGDDTVLEGGDTLVISGKAPALALAEDKLLSG